MTRPNHRILAGFGVALLTTGAFYVGHVLATGAPTVAPLVYGGTVTDKDGKAYPTEVDVTVAFYDAAAAGNLKCTSSLAKAAAGNGRFETTLPAECVAAVRETADLWSELTVGSGAAKTVMPRSHVGAVPYALEADSAKVAGAAVGGLKTTVDSLQVAVDALKASGGGGPWVVDKNGVKLGRLMGINTGSFSLLTSKRYAIFASPEALGVAQVYFAQKDCQGVPHVMGGSMLNSFAFFWNGTWYGTGASIEGMTTGTSKSLTSFWTANKCEATMSNSPSVALTPLSPAELGLPQSIGLPLTVQL